MLELIVVLAISGIVILNVVGLYLFIQKQYLNYKKQVDSEIEQVQLISILNNDIHLAEIIKSKENQLLIEKKNGTKATYNIVNEKLIREADRIDTFEVAIKNMKVKSDKEYELVYMISFDIKKGENFMPFEFFKTYDNATLVNQEIKYSR